MLAAIPSVVFGLWGIFVVIPVIRPLANWLNETLGFIPFFGTSLSGPGMLPAADRAGHHDPADGRRDLAGRAPLVPYRTKEAAYGMGATRWEVILKVMVPTASGGIFSAMVLGFGRALGETMALAMLIGNSNQISLSLFSPADTLASLLASHFPEAGPARGPGADVRGAGPAGDHPDRQHRRHRHPDDDAAQDLRGKHERRDRRQRSGLVRRARRS